jgi:phosphoribosylglycinamide formyltransferase-1
MTKNIVILASGKGSNTKRIIDHFLSSEQIHVSHIISNKESAGVLDVARSENINHSVLDKQSVVTGALLDKLNNLSPTLVVLAGYLLKVPEEVVDAFPEKIVNLHPSLLPKYGGKGMYGERVIKAVLDSQEPETGISIHLVNNEFDKGRVLQQHRCPVSVDDTVESLTKKVRALEHKYFPLAIEELLT